MMKVFINMFFLILIINLFNFKMLKKNKKINFLLNIECGYNNFININNFLLMNFYIIMIILMIFDMEMLFFFLSFFSIKNMNLFNIMFMNMSIILFMFISMIYEINNFNIKWLK